MDVKLVSNAWGGNDYNSQTQPSASKQLNVDNLDASAQGVGPEAVYVNSTNQAVSTEDNSSKNDKSIKEDQASLKELKEIRKLINNNTIPEFGYNEPTKRITIKIKDKNTNEVIREIPSEKALEMLAKAWELAGIMVDEKR